MQQPGGRVHAAGGVVEPVDAPALCLRAEHAQRHAHKAGLPGGGDEVVVVADAAGQRPRSAGGVEHLPVVAALKPVHQARVADVPGAHEEVEVAGCVVASGGGCGGVLLGVW